MAYNHVRRRSALLTTTETARPYRVSTLPAPMDILPLGHSAAQRQGSRADAVPECDPQLLSDFAHCPSSIVCQKETQNKNAQQGRLMGYDVSFPSCKRPSWFSFDFNAFPWFKSSLARLVWNS